MNSRPRVLVVLLLIGVGLESPTYATAADVVNNGGFEQIAVPDTVIWDTVNPLDFEAVTAEEIERREGWALVPPDAGADHAFKGDAVAQNERLTAALSLASPGIAVYSRSPDRPGLQRRMALVPTDLRGEAAVALGSVQVSENTADAVTLEFATRTQAGEPMRLAVSLRRGQAFIEVKPLENAGGLRIHAPARFAVIPDFFGDDVVLDAHEFTPDRLYVPSENLLVSLLEGGDSMLVTVWPIGEQSAELLLGGEGDDRIIEATEVSFDDKSIYVATVDAPGTWHHEDVSEASSLDKDLALEWKRPFDAKWRADFSAPKRHESWNFRRGRERTWFSARGRIVYPCWFEGEQACLRLPGEDYLGLAVIYPLERTNDTPLSVFTPVDIVRETLGVGPCEYVLDREGLSNRPYGGERQLMRGAVCATTESIEPFFWAGLEQRESVVVSDMADDVLAFITTVNERIQEYRTFASKVTEICEAARRDNPALKPLADRLEEIAQEIERQYQERLEVFKTPGDTAKLTEELKELTSQESPESLGRCLELGAALRRIAGSQDGLMGRNRVTVKRLRREAAVLSATEPAAVDLAEEIRELAQQTLRRKHGMEGE